jgi:hypothetical protein
MKGITGRDGYIIVKALAYAINAIRETAQPMAGVVGQGGYETYLERTVPRPGGFV